MDDPRFYLGAHMPHWLDRLDVPLFVSHRRLARQNRLPRAREHWALDSGAFSEVAQFGRFTTSPADYVAAVARYRDEIGRLDWAAPQDHMTEPWVLAKSTIAHTVAAAQTWTVRNWLELRTLDASLPIIPVIQGQTLYDYRSHVDQYAAAGVDLTTAPLVGIGSVCRRQATAEIGRLIAYLFDDGLTLHGFGVKVDGLARYGWCLASADSMAWSLSGRRCTSCPRGRPNCANCIHYALAWRDRVVSGREAIQLTLIP